MGTYFSEPQKKQRWESGQAILHRESSEPQKTKHRRMPGETKKSEPETIKNSYGKLNYLHQEKKRKQQTHGFSLEALEAPGTPLHTEKEKHFFGLLSLQPAVKGVYTLVFLPGFFQRQFFGCIL